MATYNAYLVKFVEVINPLYKKERRAVVMAEDTDKAIEYVKKFVSTDVKDCSRIISYTGFVATSMQNQEIFLDNGTFATKDTIFYENEIVDRNKE